MAWQCKVITCMVLVLCMLLVGCSCENVKDEYELMPPLYHFENLTECFERFPTSAYCVVKTVVKPMPNSKVWRAIEKYSKRPSYHEHSLLDRGLCVDECIRILEGLSSSVKVSLDAEPITVEPYHLFQIPSKQQLAEQQNRYNRILNMCANYQLRQRYNLSGYSELERCITPETHHPTVDAYHVMFLLIVVVLLGCVSYASYNEWRNKQTTLASNDKALWMEFALQRTWSRLVTVPTSQLQRDFAFVETFRILVVFLAFISHAFMSYGAGPTANIRLLEDSYSTRLSLIVVSLFPLPVHFFFVISGMMLAVNFLEYTASKTHRIGWSYLWKGIAMRNARVFPVLFIVWFYQVSWLDWFARGPGDYRFFAMEKEFCRENGWLNFLFLNNYFKKSVMCMQHTWYLAADFQYFVVGLSLLILINRRPWMLWPMITFVTSFSIVSPILNLYYLKLPGVNVLNLKHLRYLFYFHRIVSHDHFLSHPNTGSYFSGLLAGIAYHRNRTSSAVPLLAGGTITARLLKWVPPTMVLLQASFSPLFYDLDYSEPILWNAVYGAIFRCCWGAMFAVPILYGATLWQGRYSWIHFHPLLQLLSKLSFGVFMVQFNVLKSLTQNASGSGTNFSWRIMIEGVLYTWIICYAVALVLALAVEQPAVAIFKRLFGTKHLQQINKDENQPIDKKE